MSGLIKASAPSAAIRPFSAPLHAAPPHEEDRRLPRALDRIAALEADVAAFEDALKTAREAAYQEGLLKGRDDAQRDECARVAALGSGIAQATDTLPPQFARLDALAAALVRASLSKLFEEAEDYAELTTRLIRRQVARLEQHMLLRVRVSPVDFPDQAALDALGARLDERASVIADPDLAAGDCRMDLAFGQLDLGRTSQWPELARLLDSLVEQAEA